MPFAASNIKTTNLAPGLKLVEGTWTGDYGDAVGTLTVTAGAIRGGQFWANAAGGAQVECPISFAAGSADGTQTVTIENIASVTDGQFWLLTK